MRALNQKKVRRSWLSLGGYLLLSGVFLFCLTLLYTYINKRHMGLLSKKEQHYNELLGNQEKLLRGVEHLTSAIDTVKILDLNNCRMALKIYIKDYVESPQFDTLLSKKPLPKPYAIYQSQFENALRVMNVMDSVCALNKTRARLDRQLEICKGDYITQLKNNKKNNNSNSK
jgi:hypothetical protein